MYGGQQSVRGPAMVFFSSRNYSVLFTYFLRVYVCLSFVFVLSCRLQAEVFLVFHGHKTNVKRIVHNHPFHLIITLSSDRRDRSWWLAHEFIIIRFCLVLSAFCWSQVRGGPPMCICYYMLFKETSSAARHWSVSPYWQWRFY